MATAETPKWVKGDLEFFLKDGRLGANFGNMQILDTERPKTAADIPGANPAVLAQINNRGSFSTAARLGAGCALIIKNPAAFKWAKEAWMEKFIARFGIDPRGAEAALVGVLRDLGAGGTWTCMDVAAGVPEVNDIVTGALIEMVEIGFYKKEKDGKDNGYLRFIVPPGYEKYQELVDAAQAKEWAKLDPDLKPIHQAQVEILNVNMDAINGIPCILAGEPPSGSVEVIIVVTLTLPGEGWKIQDTEHASFGPLKRRPQMVVPRPGKSPLKIDFDPGFAIAAATSLSGEALVDTCNEKVQMVLNALGWTKQQ